MKTIRLALNLAALLGVAFTAELHADMLNPMDFTSLDAFGVTNGAYVIDTDALTITETKDVSTNVLFTNPINPNHPQEFYRLIEP